MTMEKTTPLRFKVAGTNMDPVLHKFVFAHNLHRHSAKSYRLNHSYKLLIMPMAHDRMFCSVHPRMETRRVSYLHVLYKLKARFDSSSQVIRTFTSLGIRFEYVFKVNSH